MERLRVAMLSPIHWRTPPRSYGPWEQVASDITEELVRRGHDVTLYATADSITSAQLRSVTPHPLLEEPGAELDHKLHGLLHAAMAFEEADDFDVLHNHYDGYPLVMSKLVDTPVISTVHGFSSPHIHELYRRYDNVNYVSISYSDRGRCPDMNWVGNVHHGIDMHSWRASQTSDDWLGFIGRIHPHKGTHIAIDAALRTGSQLRIAGTMDTKDPVVTRYWSEVVAPHVDDEQIVYLGELGGKDKIDFYCDAKAILAPIQWEEPFGLVLIEAMASGTPVVAYGRGSVPEIVGDGVSGAVVAPDDFEAFVAGIKRVDELDRSAVRAHAEQNFSVEKMVDQYLDIYRAAVDSRHAVG